jgi:hypothetical protein
MTSHGNTPLDEKFEVSDPQRDDYLPVGRTPGHPSTARVRKALRPRYQKLKLQDGMDTQMRKRHSYVNVTTVWEMDIYDVERMWSILDTIARPVFQLEPTSFDQLMAFLKMKVPDYDAVDQYVVTTAEREECERTEARASSVNRWLEYASLYGIALVFLVVYTATGIWNSIIARPSMWIYYSVSGYLVGGWDWWTRTWLMRLIWPRR